MPSESCKVGWRNKGRRRRELMLALIERDNGRCRYCDVGVVRGDGVDFPPNMATTEHFPIPKRCLPMDQWFDLDRVILACHRCNQHQELVGGLMPLDYVAPAEIMPPGILAQRLAGLI